MTPPETAGDPAAAASETDGLTPMIAPVITGLQEIAERYDAMILDLWGVLHDGEKTYPGVPDALRALRERGTKLCLLSNVPRREAPVTARLERLGITTDLYDTLVTSGEATHDALKSLPDEFHQALGPRAYVIAPVDEADVIADTGKETVPGPEQADFLLAIGISDVSETLDDFRPVLDAGLKRGLPLLCANPDLVVNAGDVLAICAGQMAAYYAENGGRVAYHGKPHAPIYARCFERLGLTPGDEGAKRRILAVGDGLRTDIKGAERIGIDSLLVTGGIHRAELGASFGDAPEQAALEALYAKIGRRPSYAIPAFRW